MQTIHRKKETILNKIKIALIESTRLWYTLETNQSQFWASLVQNIEEYYKLKIAIYIPSCKSRFLIFQKTL